MHVFPPFKDNGTKAVFYQSQGSKQSSRACSDDNNLRTVTHIGILRMQILVVRRHFVHINPYLQVHIDSTLTRINTTLQHTYSRYITLTQALLTGQVMAQGLLVSRHMRQHPQLQFLCHVCSFLAAKI